MFIMPSSETDNCERSGHVDCTCFALVSVRPIERLAGRRREHSVGSVAPEALLQMKNLCRTLAAVSLVATPFFAARADLVLFSPSLVTLGGTGLGAVNTILTIQSQGNNTTETGCVSFNGSTDVIGNVVSGGACTGAGGDVKTGASQTQTRTLSEAGITTGSNFAVFFNAVEPAGNGITLNTLVASFYNSAGLLLHSAVYAGPHDFDVTDPGTGKSGYVFTLNAAEAATLQTFITSLGAGNIRVGISASAGNPVAATGGNDTFFIFNANTPVGAVPEPSTAALLATGIFGLAAIRRRRRRS